MILHFLPEHDHCKNFYIIYDISTIQLLVKGGAMAKAKQMVLPRYYIRDDEGLDFWCFDARYFGGTNQA
jgi:hypothetical protein